MQDAPTHYIIIDRLTGAQVGQAKTREKASQSVNKRDLAYGACRYYAQAVYEKEATTNH